MNSYKLNLTNGNIFYTLVKDFGAADKFRQSNLLEVIITPEINCWKIKLQTPENLEEKILSGTEKFLADKFSVEVKISAEKISGQKNDTRNKLLHFFVGSR